MIDARRRAARPLRSLTDDEVATLAELSGLERFLRDPFASRLGDLAELAASEADARELDRDLEHERAR